MGHTHTHKHAHTHTHKHTHTHTHTHTHARTGVRRDGGHVAAILRRYVAAHLSTLSLGGEEEEEEEFIRILMDTVERERERERVQWIL